MALEVALASMVLLQNEADALPLDPNESVDSDGDGIGDKADEDDDGEQKSGIQAILSSALVSYERLPMLEVVFDRLVRLMSGSLRNFTSDNVEVSIDSMTSVR